MYNFFFFFFFDQPVRNDQNTNDNIRKIATGDEDDYATDCLLNYVCFYYHYR